MISQLGRTIRLFLVDGSPLGLIAAEIIGWTGKVLSFPRGLLPLVLKRSEIAKTGVYFLVGPDPNNPSRPLVYIGESDDVANRLKQHDNSEDKDFFDQVALLVSKDDNLTKSHVRYLETRLIEVIHGLGVASLHNGTKGSRVQLPESELADMEYVIQQLLMVMPVLGFSFLQEKPSRRPSQVETTVPQDTASEPPLFEMKADGGSLFAQAYEQDGQFIVLPGANLRYESALQDTTGCYDFRQDKQTLLEAGKLIPLTQEYYYQLNTEMAFKSPSAASCFIRHRRQYNGRVDWKVKGTNQTYGDWRKAQLELTQLTEQVDDLGQVTG